jgi:peptidoglycan/LPS O-acetylase OafA/YrhL
MLLGVIFHATMSFLPGPQIWAVADTEKTPVLAGVFFVAHIFRMTTFFLIAGFFAHMVIGKRGVAAFVKDRLKRIALPLVVGWPILLVSILLASGYAAYVATGTFPTQLPAQGPQPALSFPLTHLWFLYVLLWLYLGALGLKALVARLDRNGAFRRLVDSSVAHLVCSPLAAVACAIPVAAAFYLSPDWLVWFGVPTPDSNLIPNPIAAIQFGLAFGLGWLIHRQIGLLDELRRHWFVNLAAAVVLSALALHMLGQAPVVTPDKPGLTKLAHACVYALASWTWTFGVIGTALKFLDDESPVRRYIADSSYWIYLIHLPLVIVLQAAVSQLDWSWEAKFAAVLGVGFAIMFASYELLVRHTFVGAVLNGRRVPWRARKAAPVAHLPETAR